MSNISLGVNVYSKQSTHIQLKDLTNHVAVFGRSGSGKTGTIISLLEQCLLYGISATVIDIKGDLSRLLHQSGALSKAFDSYLLTPGASHGDPVSLFGNLADPERSDLAITNILRLVGVDSSKTKESYHLYLSSILAHHKNVTLDNLVNKILNPGFSSMGQMDLDDILKKSQRKNLAAKINNLIASSNFDIWRHGWVLDFGKLSSIGHGKLTVVSVAHLIDEEERMAALTFILEEYRKWVISLSGTDELRAVLAVDECQGLIPPYPKNPSTKTPLMSLLKQARAFGVGVILGTQSVKAIDYQALGQCNTWLIGQLKTKIDRDRILEGMTHLDQSAKSIDSSIAGLQAREFIAMSGNKISKVKSRDCLTELGGPLTSKELANFVSQGFVTKLYKKPESVIKSMFKGLWRSYE